MFFALQHAAVAALATAVAFALGCLLTTRVTWQGRGEQFTIASTLGFATWGQVFFMLGLVGWLRPWPVALSLAIGAAIAIPAIRFPRREAEVSAAEGWRWLAVGLLIAPSLLVFTLRAIHPPAGPDSTMYHLPYAAAFAATGSMPYLPDLRFPAFPQLQELLFTAAILLWNDLAAQLLQVVAALLTAGLLVAWGRTAGAPGAGIVAAAAWLGTPMVWWLAGQAYIDFGLTLLVTAAAFAMDRWRRTGDRSWLTLAAWMAGCAAASKYTGLFAVVAVVGLAAWDGPGRRRWRAALWAAAVAGLALAPCYLHIYWLTGTPVHPFLQTVFTGTETPHSLPLLDALDHRKGGLSSGLIVWLQLPWTLAKASWGHEWSLSYLIGVPLAAWFAWREPWARRFGTVVVLWSLVYALIIFPDPRHLLPMAPLWCLLAALGAERLLRRIPGAALRAGLLATLALLAASPGLGIAARSLPHQLKPPVTAQEREAYLLRHTGGYRLIAHLNDQYGSDYSVYTTFAEPLRYFARGRFQGDWFGPAAYGTVFPLMADGEKLAQRLLELDADHLLFGDFGHVATPRVESREFRCRFELVMVDARTRLYRILDPPRCPDGS